MLKLCANCNHLFWAARSIMNHCGVKCYRERRNKKLIPKVTHAMRLCVWCGDKFQATCVKKLYCCKDCMLACLSHNGKIAKGVDLFKHPEPIDAEMDA